MPTYDDVHNTTQRGALSHSLQGRALRLVGATISSWLARSRQRKALAELDDRLLRDIGITPAEATREAGRPFWCGGKA